MSKELRIYKPGSNGTAVKFQLAEKGKYKDMMVFAEFASQTGKDDNGNARFDWRGEKNPESKAINVKLSELDAAKLLLVLRDETEANEIFHDPNKSYEESDGTKRSTVLKIARGEKGYMLNASHKAGDTLNKVGVSVAWDEAILLKVFLETFLQKSYA